MKFVLIFFSFISFYFILILLSLFFLLFFFLSKLLLCFFFCVLVVSQIFRDFSRRVGVRDIREYEKRYVEQAMSRLQQRKLYEDQISKLRSRFSFVFSFFIGLFCLSVPLFFFLSYLIALLLPSHFIASNTKSLAN